MRYASFALDPSRLFQSFFQGFNHNDEVEKRTSAEGQKHKCEYAGEKVSKLANSSHASLYANKRDKTYIDTKEGI